MILEETIDILFDKYYDQIKDLTIEDIVIGVFKTSVKLSDNSYGISSTSVNSQLIHGKKKDRDFGNFTPGKIKGSKVVDLLKYNKDNGLIRTVQITVLNAISSKILNSGIYKVMDDTDPIDILDFDENSKVTIVGAFHSYIKKVKEKGSKLTVLELNEEALYPEDRIYFAKADSFKEVLVYSDFIIITGLTLVNNTLDELLKHANPKAKIVLTGPSSSLIPDILFKKGVDYIGGVKIKDYKQLWHVVKEGGAGFHAFKYGSEKICIVNDRN